MQGQIIRRIKFKYKRKHEYFRETTE
jgi:hypothetical protein